MNIERLLMIAVTVALGAVLAACDLDLDFPEFTSGTASDTVKVWTLTDKQLKDVSAWFMRHRSGWTQSIVPTGPHFVIRLTHADGTAMTVDIRGRSLVVATR